MAEQHVRKAPQSRTGHSAYAVSDYMLPEAGNAAQVLRAAMAGVAAHIGESAGDIKTAGLIDWRLAPSAIVEQQRAAS